MKSDNSWHLQKLSPEKIVPWGKTAIKLAPTFCFILSCLLCFTYPIPVLGHDIDVTRVARVFLDEAVIDENVLDSPVPSHFPYSYRLSIVDLRVPIIENFSAALPQKCDVQSLPESLFPSSGDIYGFACEQALGLKDNLLMPWDLEGVVVIANWSDGTVASAFFRGNGQQVVLEMGSLKASAGSLLNLASSYSIIGVEHILFGIDHLLFVLGLLLLVKGGWLLVKTITAFTVAHSITLALVVLGVIPVPPAATEAIIALSIILLAREVLMGHRGKMSLVHKKPWLVALIFGFIHGFGFAGALGELGLRSSDVPVALLFFNIGVEVGQLLFIAALLLIMAMLRSIQRQRMVYLESACAYGLGGVAMFWFFERLTIL